MGHEPSGFISIWRGTIPQARAPFGVQLAGLFDTIWAWVTGLVQSARLAFALPVVQAQAEQEEEVLPPEGQIWKNYVLVNDQRVAVREHTSTSSEVYFLLGDHLGSTSVTTDASGTIVSEIRYTAYGEERYSSGTTPTNYLYTGQLSKTETIGLYYYNARWYDPYLNHFVQADTIVPGINNPLVIDRYAYVIYNPSNLVDPTGYWMCDIYDLACAQKPEEETAFWKMQIGGIDNACKADAACAQAYETYIQIAVQLARRPTVAEVLSMTARAEGYTVTVNTTTFFVEALARNYYQPYAACERGSHTCTGNKLYKFMSGYQPWWTSQMTPSERATYLIANVNSTIGNDALHQEMGRIMNVSYAQSQDWTNGMEADEPWQWHNYWRAPTASEALGWDWSPSGYGNYFWVMTADQTQYFQMYIKPIGPPE